MSYTDIVDRIAADQGRRKITPEGGTTYYATVERADNPTVAGTPINRALLSAIGILEAEVTRTGTTVAIVASVVAKTIRFFAPSDFSKNDTYTLNGAAFTIKDYDGGSLTYAWKSGAPVELIVNGDVGFFDIGCSPREQMHRKYPVGTPYQNATDSRNPSVILGIGTWRSVSNKFLLAESTSHPAGSTGGTENETLTLAQIPIHCHQGIWLNDKTVTLNTGGVQYNLSWGVTGVDNAEIRTADAGGGQAHNNMPPFESVYTWIRTA